MSILSIPIDGEIVVIEVPAVVRTVVARTIVLEAGFHRRTGQRIVWPDRWARKIADNVIADHADPAHWASRLEQIERRTMIARRKGDSRTDVDLPGMVRRLFDGALEDGTVLPETDENVAQVRFAWQLAGHGQHDSGCRTCERLEHGDVRAFLRETGLDPVLLRLMHTELVAADRLPALPGPSGYGQQRTIDDLADI